MEPRHAEVTKTLIRDIASGIYPVGSLLPGEFELAGLYGVSRGTVRTALLRIQELGLVSRRKRAGTRVESTVPRSTDYAQRLSTIEELVQYDAETQRTVHGMEEVVVDIELSRKLGCAPGTRWLHILMSRAIPDSTGYPLSWSDVYVTIEDGKKIRSQLKSSSGLICDLIGHVTGRLVKEVRQSIRAVGVPKELARVLGTAPDAHALEFVRQYVDQSDQLFEVAISIHPGDRFVHSTLLQRQAK